MIHQTHKIQIKNTNKQITLANKVKVCATWLERLIGLLGTSDMKQEEAYWLSNCNCIHTFGMKYDLQAYVLDSKGIVLDILKMKPNRISPMYFEADAIVEMKAGQKILCQIGDRLICEEG